MAQIECDQAYQRCRRRSASGDVSEMPLSLDEIRYNLAAGYEVAIYIDGWSEPWNCWVAPNDELHATCPTAPRVTPRVVSVSRDGAVFTGEVG